MNMVYLSIYLSFSVFQFSVCSFLCDGLIRFWKLDLVLYVFYFFFYDK